MDRIEIMKNWLIKSWIIDCCKNPLNDPHSLKYAVIHPYSQLSKMHYQFHRAILNGDIAIHNVHELFSVATEELRNDMLRTLASVDSCRLYRGMILTSKVDRYEPMHPFESWTDDINVALGYAAGFNTKLSNDRYGCILWDDVPKSKILSCHLSCDTWSNINEPYDRNMGEFIVSSTSYSGTHLLWCTDDVNKLLGI